MTRFARKSKTRRRGSERRRRIAIVAVMAVLASSLLLVGREVLTGARPPAVEAQTLADTLKETQDAEVYTGSILFMPHDGKTCRQYLFDNISGRLNDNGMVDCAPRRLSPGECTAEKMVGGARARHQLLGFRER